MHFIYHTDTRVRDRMLVLGGHLGATSDIVAPVVDTLLLDDVNEDVVSAGLAFLTNLASEVHDV